MTGIEGLGVKGLVGFLDLVAGTGNGVVDLVGWVKGTIFRRNCLFLLVMVR